MDIKVLGTGCPKCKKLYQNSMKAIEMAGISGEVGKVEDMDEIASYAVLMTPALVIDGDVVSSGKVLAPDKIAEMINERGDS